MRRGWWRFKLQDQGAFKLQRGSLEKPLPELDRAQLFRLELPQLQDLLSIGLLTYSP